jgi:hypothetical protein
MSQQFSEPAEEPPATLMVRYFDVTKDYQAQLPNCLHKINARSKFASCDECGKPAMCIFYDRVAYAIKCQDHIKETNI